MPTTLNPQMKRALADRIRYYNELGIYDFYRRESQTAIQIPSEERESLPEPKLPQSFQSRNLSKSKVNCLTLHPIRFRRCSPFVKISAIAPVVLCTNKDANRLSLVWAILKPT